MQLMLTVQWRTSLRLSWQKQKPNHIHALEFSSQLYFQFSFSDERWNEHLTHRVRYSILHWNTYRNEVRISKRRLKIEQFLTFSKLLFRFQWIWLNGMNRRTIISCWIRIMSDVIRHKILSHWHRKYRMLTLPCTIKPGNSVWLSIKYVSCNRRPIR